ncbi:TPA: capsular biosynthesis protein CpsH [Streptococcus agalactiae]|nr:capsular biosynthesis protein CpsH [Streptococcus agalactiae]
MKINKNSLFYIAIFLVNFFKSLGLGEGNSAYKIVMLVAILLCGIKFLLDSLYFERRKLVIIFLLFIATILNLFFVHKVTFILTLIFFLALKDISLKKAFSIIIGSRILGVLLNQIFVKLDLIEIKYVNFYRDGQFILRSDLGFGHPNFIHNFFALTIFLYIVLNYKRLKPVVMVLFLTLNYLLYQYTFSRTGYYIVILFMVLIYVTKNSLIKRVFMKLAPYVQFFLLVFTFLSSTIFFNSNFVQKLDVLLTGRLHYAHLQLVDGLTPFGNSFKETSVLFDNSYSMLLSMYGVVLTMFCMIIYYIYSKKIIIIELQLLLFIMSIILFTESFYPSVVMNISWLVFGKIFCDGIEPIKKEFTIVNNI